MRVAFLASVLCLSCLVQAQLGGILKKADETLNQRNTPGLSNDKIIAGLKEAFRVSTGKTVALTGKPDGFLKNEAIKIPLPPKLQTVGKGMGRIGMGAKVDELEVGMNRAAEQATPQSQTDIHRGGEENEFWRCAQDPDGQRYGRHRVFQAHQFGGPDPRVHAGRETLDAEGRGRAAIQPWAGQRSRRQCSSGAVRSESARCRQNA